MSRSKPSPGRPRPDPPDFIGTLGALSLVEAPEYPKLMIDYP